MKTMDIDIDVEWMPRNWVILDIETPGLDPQVNGIVEIAAMRPDGDVYSEVCRPRLGSLIDPAALRVNGHTVAGLETCAVTEGQAVAGLLTWLGEGDWILCGLNVGSFDEPFVAHSRWVHGNQFGNVRIGHRFVDLHSWACAYAMMQGLAIPERGYSADAISDLLEIPREERPHSAPNGVMWTARAFQALFAAMKGGES